MQTDVLIIGGGLSGLHTAYELGKFGVNFILAEARERLGGRILSHYPNGRQSLVDIPGFDLGPTWFWPGQSRIQTLLDELGLVSDIFEQASFGAALYEDPQGNIRRGIDGISMAGSYRLKGGMQQLITTLAQQISSDSISQNAKVEFIRRQQHCLLSSILIDGEARVIESQFVVLALPPRLAISSIQFKPALSQNRLSELNTLATWMAGHAKVVALYEKPFWRERDLSGDAISHRGPMHEIHDASPASGGPYALFGFVSVPAKNRRGHESEIRVAAIEQFSRMFGEQASAPLDVFIKDWALDPYTATAADQGMLTYHPGHSLKETTETSWQDRIIWSGTETAQPHERNNGYLEGALEASERTVRYITGLQ